MDEAYQGMTFVERGCTCVPVYANKFVEHGVASAREGRKRAQHSPVTTTTCRQRQMCGCAQTIRGCSLKQLWLHECQRGSEFFASSYQKRWHLQLALAPIRNALSLSLSCSLSTLHCQHFAGEVASVPRGKLLLSVWGSFFVWLALRKKKSRKKVVKKVLDPVEAAALKEKKKFERQAFSKLQVSNFPAWLYILCACVLSWEGGRGGRWRSRYCVATSWHAHGDARFCNIDAGADWLLTLHTHYQLQSRPYPAKVAREAWSLRGRLHFFLGVASVCHRQACWCWR